MYLNVWMEDWEGRNFLNHITVTKVKFCIKEEKGEITMEMKTKEYQCVFLHMCVHVCTCVCSYMCVFER